MFAVTLVSVAIALLTMALLAVAIRREKPFPPWVAFGWMAFIAVWYVSVAIFDIVLFVT